MATKRRNIARTVFISAFAIPRLVNDDALALEQGAKADARHGQRFGDGCLYILPLGAEEASAVAIVQGSGVIEGEFVGEVAAVREGGAVGGSEGAKLGGLNEWVWAGVSSSQSPK